jgi:hypothetical protein
VDALLAAATYSSPHTTPTKARRFAFQDKVERRLFEQGGVAGPVIKSIDEWIEKAEDDVHVWEVLRDGEGRPTLVLGMFSTHDYQPFIHVISDTTCSLRFSRRRSLLPEIESTEA